MLRSTGNRIIEEYLDWLVSPGPRGDADPVVVAMNAKDGWVDLRGTPPSWPAEATRVVLVPAALERWYTKISRRGGPWATSNGDLLSLQARRDLWEAIWSTVNKNDPSMNATVRIDDRVLF